MALKVLVKRLRGHITYDLDLGKALSACSTRKNRTGISQYYMYSINIHVIRFGVTENIWPLFSFRLVAPFVPSYDMNSVVKLLRAMEALHTYVYSLLDIVNLLLKTGIFQLNLRTVLCYTKLCS